MALIHEATLTPDKLELLAGWVPTRPWSGGSAEVEKVGTYRFDDPAGEVGVESFLLRTGDGVLLHVPLTYRGAPLAGAEEHLVGVLEHSVLGTRWAYDGCADPVYATTLAATVLTGATQAELVMAPDAGGATLPPSVTVVGSGTPGTPVPEVTEVTCVDDGPTTVVDAGGVELVVVRVVGEDLGAEHTLTGRWAGGGPAVLAGVRVRA
jgi:hypothetical protein